MVIRETVVSAGTESTRVLLTALAHAGQVTVLTGAPGAAAPVSRLLLMLRDKGMTDWADEALGVVLSVL